MLDPNFDNIPPELREREAWVCWHVGCRNCHTAFEPHVETCPNCGADTTKIPDDPVTGTYAKSNDPQTWTDFETAVAYHKRGGTKTEGIGFMFDENGPFVGVDLDGCVRDGDLTGGAWNIVKKLDSYTEGSPSGTGLHIIIRAFITSDRNRTADVKGLKELEIYESGRYFTFTGRSLESTPKTVEQRARELHSLCEEVFPSNDKTETRQPQTPVDLDDRELIEKAKQAKKGDKFRRLWDGNTSGYESHSEAQQALANKLAFWTGGDEDRMVSLFISSGMCRGDDDVRKFKKYDMPTALEGKTEFYEPDRQTAGGAPSGDGQATDQPELVDDLSGWDAILALYDQGEKRDGRYEASRRTRDDLKLATDRKSERMYVWNPETAVLEDHGEQAIGELLVDKLGPHWTRHEEGEIIQRVKHQTYRDSFGGPFVPLRNGDLFVEDNASISEFDLKEPTPERAPRARSAARWDKEARCPTFRKFLREAVPTKEERFTLQEYTGYCLMHWAMLLHKALFIVGPTASGKSTFLKVLRALLGAVASVSPHELVNGRFGAIELEHAWANIYTDINSSVLQNIGKFKQILAGEPMHAERKHQQGYEIEPTAKHLYSANRLPDVSIDDDAFFRRILLVSFPTTVPRDERDPKLADRLIDELDGVLLWAVEGLQRLMQNDAFTHDPDPQDTRRRWEEHSSSIGRFKAAALKVTGNQEDDVEAKEAVFTAYTEFCQDQGLSTETQQNLTRQLKRDPRISDAKRTPSYADTQCRCYTGIQIRDDWHPESDVPF